MFVTVFMLPLSQIFNAVDQASGAVAQTVLGTLADRPLLS